MFSHKGQEKQEKGIALTRNHEIHEAHGSNSVCLFWYNIRMSNEMFERNLPPYLAHDLEAWKKGVEEKSHLLDCLWGELYGSINIAEINDNLITHEQAQYLRDKYLWGKDV